MNEILALLDDASNKFHEAFPNSQRTELFDAHLATVKMTVEHAGDEAERTANEPV